MKADPIIYNSKSTKWATIDGNIGTGKSTLAELMIKHLKSRVNGEVLDFKLIEEPYEENPYFDAYYKALTRFYTEGLPKRPNPVFFHSQYWFLTRTANQNSEVPIIKLADNPLGDRSLYGHGLFALHLINLGLIKGRNTQIYLTSHSGLTTFPQPDLPIYLLAEPPTSLKRIKDRGRIQEKDISLEYLEGLHELHEEWCQNSAPPGLLTIPTDDLDIVHSRNDQEYILNTIAKVLEDRLD